MTSFICEWQYMQIMRTHTRILKTIYWKRLVVSRRHVMSVGFCCCCCVQVYQHATEIRLLSQLPCLRSSVNNMRNVLLCVCVNARRDCCCYCACNWVLWGPWFMMMKVKSSNMNISCTQYFSHYCHWKLIDILDSCPAEQFYADHLYTSRSVFARVIIVLRPCKLLIGHQSQVATHTASAYRICTIFIV